jgi:CRISPR system Cascade subunit CasA
MTYDLRVEGWIPFSRADGRIEWGPPSLLTDAIQDNPIVALAAPRPDFNGALTEFLIGLVSAALKAEDEEAWLDYWNQPPPPADLAKALATLPPAFDLDGDGLRFLQDFAAADFADDKTVNDIEALLIDAAGGQTAKLNKDLFVKRDRVVKMGRPAAAMALIALQSYAPAGGQGHRVSMRGGGPLTTLIEPRSNAASGPDKPVSPLEKSLWRKIWANAETVTQWDARGPDTADADDAYIFPWLASVRTSDGKAGGCTTTKSDGHPLQAYFGMPRRIRLDFTPEKDVCDLTGRTDDVLVKQYRTRNYGVEYDGWQHPLTPYYQDKKMQHLPVHGQARGISWRDWAGLLFQPEKDVGAAQAVMQFMQHRARATGIFKPRLHVFGYDMDNMKARGWIDAELPAFALAPKDAEKIMRIAGDLTEAARIISDIVLYAVKSARFANPKEAKGDFSVVKAQFWDRSEAAFFAAIQAAVAGAERVETLKGFHAPLLQIAQTLFNDLSPMEGLEFADVRRLVAARYGLGGALRGHGTMGKSLFKALALPLPDKPAKSKARKEAAA